MRVCSQQIHMKSKSALCARKRASFGQAMCKVTSNVLSMCEAVVCCARLFCGRLCKALLRAHRAQKSLLRAQKSLAHSDKQQSRTHDKQAQFVCCSVLQCVAVCCSAPTTIVFLTFTCIFTKKNIHGFSAAPSPYSEPPLSPLFLSVDSNHFLSAVLCLPSSLPPSLSPLLPSYRSQRIGPYSTSTISSPTCTYCCGSSSGSCSSQRGLKR